MASLKMLVRRRSTAVDQYIQRMKQSNVRSCTNNCFVVNLVCRVLAPVVVEM